MKNDKDESICKKKLLDTARIAYERGITVTSDFLGLAEQTIFHELRHDFPPIGFTIYGGCDYAERFCVRFDGSSTGTSFKELELSSLTKELYPISCLCVTPLGSKFKEELTHRDYLGALLALGINRCKIGDIFLQEKAVYVFCMTHMAEFICNEWRQVKHTFIHCEIISNNFEGLAPTFKEIISTVPSLRLDALIAAAFQTSRSSLISSIEGGKVFVNGKMILKPGYEMKEKDQITVRGKGRFFLDEIRHLTKKGRTAIVIKKYE